MTKQRRRNMQTRELLALASCCILLMALPLCDAWSPTHQLKHFNRKATGLHYDLDVYFQPAGKIRVSEWLSSQFHAKRAHNSTFHPTIQRAFPSSGENTFQAVREWQANFICDKLTNLRALPVMSRKGQDMSFIQAGTQSMETHFWESNEYRLIRMTNFDAGKGSHVYSSMLYPRSSLMPVLGLEMIRMGKSLHICAADFQPVASSDDDDLYLSLLQPIRKEFPSLQGKLRDGNMGVLFSENMLLGTHTPQVTDVSADEMLHRDFLPAFQQYQRIHTDLVQRSTERVPEDKVMKHHEVLDTTAATVDKSHNILAKAFGDKWADDYIHGIMFQLAQKQVR